MIRSESAVERVDRKHDCPFTLWSVWKLDRGLILVLDLYVVIELVDRHSGTSIGTGFQCSNSQLLSTEARHCAENDI